jgi:accessory gene regulator B
MEFIEKISKSTSEKLGNRLNKTEEEKSILNYGLFIIMHTSLALILTLIIGILTNMTLEIMVITFSAAWMKRYSGGVHASSPNRCLIIGVIVSLTLSFLDKRLMYILGNNSLIFMLIIGFIVSYIILYYKCPVGSKNKPLKKEVTRKKLRKKAFRLINFYLLIILIGYLLYINKNIYILKVVISCIWLGLILQVLMLTKIGQKIIILLDYILKKIKVS